MQQQVHKKINKTNNKKKLTNHHGHAVTNLSEASDGTTPVTRKNNNKHMLQILFAEKPLKK